MLPADKARIGSFSDRIQVDPRDFTSDHGELLNILRTELQFERADAAVERGERRHHRAAAPAGTPRGAGVHRRRGCADELQRQQQQPQGRDEAGRGRGRDGLRDRPRRIERLCRAARWRRSAAAAAGGGGGGFGGGFGGGRYGGGSRGGQPDKPDEGLPKIAAATGGGYFELTSTDDLASTFTRVADELHHQYALGFTPTAARRQDAHA